jgi:hypothetical protein
MRTCQDDGLGQKNSQRHHFEMEPKLTGDVAPPSESTVETVRNSVGTRYVSVYPDLRSWLRPVERSEEVDIGSKQYS